MEADREEAWKESRPGFYRCIMSTSTDLITVFASSVSLSLFLSRIMLVCAFDTRQPPFSSSPNRSVKSEKRGAIDDLESKCGVWTQLFAYLFRGRARGNDESDDIEERFALVAKIHREKVSIDSRVYTWRDFLARDGPLALVCSEFYRRFQFFASIDFCLELFFFSIFIELVYRVWTMFGIVVKEIYFLLFFFFLRDEELLWILFFFQLLLN